MPTRSVPVSAISGGSRAAISSSAVERISSWVPLVSMVPPLAPPPSEAADPPSEAPEPPELPAPSEQPPAAAGAGSEQAARALSGSSSPVAARARRDRVRGTWAREARSEEHTSELQSRGHLVCRLLLEKKKRAQSQ